MAIFDAGPIQISDYISDINQLIISLNQSRSTSIPLVLVPRGAAEMLASLNQIVQALNNAGASIPLFNGPQDTSAFLSLLNNLNILGGVVSSIPSWVLSGASVDMDFANNRYYGGTLASLLTFTRSSVKTNLLPTSVSGFGYTSFGNNVPAITPGLGVLIEEARTNLFLNSTAPATQTITLSATGNYTLWVNGAGSAAIAAGTATISGAGTATNGAPIVINCTVTGTVVVTITGALNACQLEAGTFGTSFIVTAGASAIRSPDVAQASGALATGLTATTGSLVAFLQSAAAASGAFSRVLGSGSGVGQASALYFNTTSAPSTGQFGTYNGSATQQTATTLTPPAKGGVAWSGATLSVVGGNGAVKTAAQTYVSGSPVFLGTNGVQEGINGYFSRLTVWSSRLADATLQAFTI